MPYFQTLPDFEKNKKLLKLLMLFLTILHLLGQNIKKFEISRLTSDSR